MTRVVNQQTQADEAQTQIAAQADAAEGMSEEIDDQATKIAQAELTAEAWATSSARQQATSVAANDKAADALATQAAQLDQLLATVTENDATIAAQSTVLVAQATTISGQDDRLTTLETEPTPEPTVAKRPTKRPAARATATTPPSNNSDWPSSVVDDIIANCVDSDSSYSECSCFWTYISLNIGFSDFVAVTEVYDNLEDTPGWFQNVFYSAANLCF